MDQKVCDICLKDTESDMLTYVELAVGEGLYMCNACLDTYL